jgi:hypothetical protein
MYRLFRFRRKFGETLARKENGSVLVFGRYRISVVNLMLALGLTMIASTAFAIVAPAAGSFAYDVYDIAVTKMLQGPIGFVGGVAAMIIGAVFAIQGKLMTAVPSIVGGAILLKADTLVTSLGAII